MKKLLGWWYSVSLPPRPPAASPMERERERYARLTAGFLLLLIIMFMPLAPIMLFFSPASPSSPPLAMVMICLDVLAWVFGRIGRQILSASCIIIYIFVPVTGALLTNPGLVNELLPLFSTYTIAVILAGALMPPVAALITGIAACLNIIVVGLIAFNFQQDTHAAQLHFTAVNALSVSVILPCVIQIVVAVVVYAIMRILLNTIRRADRAEEIVALQTQVAEHERRRLREKEQLEEGFRKIAETHARVANGDYRARVSLSEGHVLWSVAVPLNNLLSRLQHWRNDADALVLTRRAAAQVSEQLHYILQTGQVRELPLTGTPLDPVVLEVNQVMGVLASLVAERRVQR